jgi:hypothetical protein
LWVTGKAAAQDLAEMRDSVIFEGPTVTHKLSRFWIPLVLSSIIASAGVVADSTATVIGAMIVAPLMIPIQGVMLSVVIGDRVHLAGAQNSGMRTMSPVKLHSR